MIVYVSRMTQWVEKGLVSDLTPHKTAWQDRTFTKIGWMIIASYTFYTPVILFIQRVPMLGMLMIPKTMAYVAIAWIGYVNLFPKIPADPAVL